jgi:hypothetical protein
MAKAKPQTPKRLACLLFCALLAACAMHPSVEQLVGAATEKCRQGQYDEAVGDVNLALERYKVLSEPERAAAGKSLVHLADGLESGVPPGPNPKNQSALGTACRISVSIRELIQGPEHPAMEGPAKYVAASAMERADYAVAEPLWRHVIVIRERQRLPKDIELMNAKAQLAVICDATDRFGEAEKLFKDVLVYHDTPPRSDPAMHKVAIGNVARFYEKHGKFVEAAILRKKAASL